MTSMVLNHFEITVSFEQLIKFFYLFSRKIHKYTHTFLHTFREGDISLNNLTGTSYGSDAQS